MDTVTVLVACATRYGSTLEVGEAVAARLREGGFRAEVRRSREMPSIEGFGAVVVGSPLYVGSLIKEARRFLERHREALVRVPVAVFALGPISPGEELAGARAQLDAALARVPWLAPAARETFVGRYDPAMLRFPDSLLAALPVSPLYGMKARDERDWAAIRRWAETLPAALGLGGSGARA